MRIMSDSEDTYTIVDELEEGEIVENVPYDTKKCLQSKRKRKSNIQATSSPVENHLCQHKKEKLPNRTLEVPRRYRSPLNGPFSFSVVLSPKKPHASQINSDFTSWSTSPKDEVPFKTPLKTRGRKRFCLSLKAEHMHDLPKPELCDSTIPQLDLNSSYDDLLKHHKEIQRRLSKLEKEQSKNKKKCPHKSKRNRKRTVTSKQSFSVHKLKVDRPTTPCIKERPTTPCLKERPTTPCLKERSTTPCLKERSASPCIKIEKPTTPCIKKLKSKKKEIEKSESENEKPPEVTNKIEVVIDNRVQKSTSKAQSHNSKCENTSNITVSVQNEELFEKAENHDDDELELLRQSVLMSVSSRTTSTKDSIVNNATEHTGLGKENTVPNAEGCSSSAFSVSGSCDNYSVIDIDVDEDSFMSSKIEVLSPQNSQSHSSGGDDDDDIAMMREMLLQSLNRQSSKQEPGSPNPPVAKENLIKTSGHSESLVSHTETHATANFVAKSSETEELPVQSNSTDGCSISGCPQSNLDAACWPYEAQFPDSGLIETFSSVLPSHGILLPSNTGLTDSSVLSSFPSAAEVGSVPVLPGTVQSNSINANSVKLPHLNAPSSPPPLVSESAPNLLKADKTCPNSKTSPKKFLHNNTAPKQWVYMKQEPLIIKLGQDSSDSESSDSQDESEAPLIFDSLEELIRSEKMKTTCKQSNPSEECTEVDKTENSDPPLQTLQDPKLLGRNSSPNHTESVSSGAVSNELSCPPSMKGNSAAKALLPSKYKKTTEVKTSKVSAELMREYTLLSRKLTLACDTLQKEQQILAMKKIIANKKKSSFINSELVTQRLKEQLAAAEKARKTNMRMMFIANAELETVQNSVLRRTVLLKQMREQHQKLEEQISSSVPFSLDVILGSNE